MKSNTHILNGNEDKFQQVAGQGGLSDDPKTLFVSPVYSWKENRERVRTFSRNMRSLAEQKRKEEAEQKRKEEIMKMYSDLFSPPKRSLGAEPVAACQRRHRKTFEKAVAVTLRRAARRRTKGNGARASASSSSSSPYLRVARCRTKGNGPRASASSSYSSSYLRVARRRASRNGPRASTSSSYSS